MSKGDLVIANKFAKTILYLLPTSDFDVQVTVHREKFLQ